MSEKKSVYQLIDPRDGSAHYTGASTDPFKALRKHLRARDTETNEWIEELTQSGLRPDLRVVALDTEDWSVLVRSLREPATEANEPLSQHGELLRSPVPEINYLCAEPAPSDPGPQGGGALFRSVAPTRPLNRSAHADELSSKKNLSSHSLRALSSSSAAPALVSETSAGEQNAPFAAQVKHARQQARISQADLGARVGKSQSYIARVESGKQEPSLTTAQQITEGLNEAWRERQAESSSAFSPTSAQMRKASEALSKSKSKRK